MQVKLLSTLWYNNSVHKIGDELELPDDIANTLAEAGTVELVQQIRQSRRAKADASDG